MEEVQDGTKEEGVINLPAGGEGEVTWFAKNGRGLPSGQVEGGTGRGGGASV